MADRYQYQYLPRDVFVGDGHDDSPIRLSPDRLVTWLNSFPEEESVVTIVAGHEGYGFVVTHTGS